MLSGTRETKQSYSYWVMKNVVEKFDVMFSFFCDSLILFNVAGTEPQMHLKCIIVCIIVLYTQILPCDCKD